VTSQNHSLKDLGPYPSGGTITMVNYANFNKKCVDSALTMFMQYSPFLLLMEVMIGQKSLFTANVTVLT
jgi:hypothetical protein